MAIPAKVQCLDGTGIIPSEGMESTPLEVAQGTGVIMPFVAEFVGGPLPVGTYAFGPEIPLGASFLFADLEILTTFDSAGSAGSIAFGTNETADGAKIKAAANSDGATLVSTTPIMDGIPNWAAANRTIKTTTASRRMLATITVAAQTTGRARIRGFYIVQG